MFELGNTVFVLVDVQGKLAAVMHAREALYRNLAILLRGMQALRVPVIWMEQIPAKMGPTIPELAAHLEGQRPIAKACFSCCASDTFLQSLKASGARQVVLGGIETHVCIYQTARDLLELGYEVEVVGDAVSSRCETNHTIALQKIAALGAGVTTAESMLFELMRTSEHPAFRDILKIVK
jgi:nicotinamidase-related amidase